MGVGGRVPPPRPNRDLPALPALPAAMPRKRTSPLADLLLAALSLLTRRTGRGRRRGKAASRGVGAARLLPRGLRARVALFANLALLLALAVWFLLQPAARQAEVRRLAANYLDSSRSVSLTQLAGDILSLYYLNRDVACDYRPAKDAPVFGGLPVPTDGRAPLRILRNTGYWVGYDETRRSPAWAAYRLPHVASPPRIAERPDQFVTDTRTLARVSSNDYTGSGFDRGHLAPNFAIARCYGEKAQQETFLMSNIVPQRHALNAGNWKTLETMEAISYPDRFEQVWVLAGPVYAATTTRFLPHGVPVPDAFYKIHVDQREGAVRAQAFLFRHAGTGKEDLQSLLVSIDTIEQLTGLDFFPDLSEEEQRQLEANPTPSVW